MTRPTPAFADGEVAALWSTAHAQGWTSSYSGGGHVLIRPPTGGPAIGLSTTRARGRGIANAWAAFYRLGGRRPAAATRRTATMSTPPPPRITHWRSGSRYVARVDRHPISGVARTFRGVDLDQADARANAWLLSPGLAAGAEPKIVLAPRTNGPAKTNGHAPELAGRLDHRPEGFAARDYPVAAALVEMLDVQARMVDVLERAGRTDAGLALLEALNLTPTERELVRLWRLFATLGR